MLKINEFGGVAPRFPDRKLPAPYAMRAHNCSMDRAQLRSFGGSTVVATGLAANTKTIFAYKPFDIEFFLEFSFLADVVQNALPNDTFRRVYWTGDPSGPRFSDYTYTIGGSRPYPSSSFLLGVPAPTVTPIIELGANIDPAFPVDPEAAQLEPYYRYFTYTFVDRYGHESAPFSMSDGGALPSIKVYEGQTASVKNLQLSPSGNFNMQNGLVRLYMTDLIGNWRLMASGAIGTSQFLNIDHMTVDSKAIMLPETAICAMPPTDLANLTNHPSGYMLGSTGSTLCATPRYFFSNWPASFQRPCAFKIQGIVPHSQGAFLITEGGLYSAIGSDSSNLTIVEIDATLGCVAKETILDMGGFAMYASNNGIVVASQTEASVVTKDVILDNDWSGYSPETMKAVRHLDRYIIWNAQHGFILRPSADKDKLTTCDFAEEFVAGYADREDGHLRYRDGTMLKKFDADPANPRPYLWESTTTIAPSPLTYSCVKIDAEKFTDLKYDVLIGGVSVYGGEQAVPPQTGNVFYTRMPPYKPSMDVKVKLSGSDPVNSMVVANSFREMKGE